jgi:hypothetical protein
MGTNNNKAFSMNHFKAANLNDYLGNNSGIGSLGKMEKADNNSYVNDFYKNLQEGKKKRGIIFG